jgi:N6-adenosine-specific RNA methylase IME4
MSWPFDPLRPFSFDFVMADPPWSWTAYSDKGLSKSPEAQYSTMSMADIAALPIGDLLAPGGLLMLWCTWPLLHKQIALPARWGLEYKTGGAWTKRTKTGKMRWGTGYLLRSGCEPFLIATLPGSMWRGASLLNVVDGEAREHSRKPEAAFAMVERALPPHARKLELFARETRPGWTTWGDEATKFDEAAA